MENQYWSVVRVLRLPWCRCCGSHAGQRRKETIRMPSTCLKRVHFVAVLVKEERMSRRKRKKERMNEIDVRRSERDGRDGGN